MSALRHHLGAGRSPYGPMAFGIVGGAGQQAVRDVLAHGAPVVDGRRALLRAAPALVA